MISAKPMAVFGLLAVAGGAAGQEPTVVGLVTELRGRLVVVDPIDVPNYRSLTKILITLKPGGGAQPLMRGELGSAFDEIGSALRSVQFVEGRAGWRDTLTVLERMERAVMRSRRLLRGMEPIPAPGPVNGSPKAIFLQHEEGELQQPPWERCWYALAEAMVLVRNAWDLREARDGLDEVDRAIRDAREEAWRALEAEKQS